MNNFNELAKYGQNQQCLGNLDVLEYASNVTGNINT